MGPRPEEIAKFGAKGIILSGGPESTTQHGAPAAPQQVFDSGLPILGICYGMQTLAAQLGARRKPRMHANSAMPKCNWSRMTRCSAA